MKDLVILENSGNFDPADIDEIMLSIGWASKEHARKDMQWAHYDMFRTYDYVAIAKLGNKTIGMLDAFCDRDNFATSYLYSIMVHKDYQRKGVGTALMQAFNKKFKHTTTWVVTPISKGKDAIAFLEKFGFKDNSANFAVCTRMRDRPLNLS